MQLALLCAVVAPGCGENYVPLYERPCEVNADCDDGLFCNGVETCTDGSTQHRVMRVRIYDLGAGGIAGLGNFGTTQAFFDKIYRVDDGNLVIVDTNADAFGFSVFNYTALDDPVDLGPGSFGLHLSFPDEGGDTAFWATAPEVGNTTNSFVWGNSSAITTPSDNGAGFANLAFSFVGQSGTLLPLAPTPAESAAGAESASSVTARVSRTSTHVDTIR